MITDLSGTTWLFHETIDFSDITYTSSNSMFENRRFNIRFFEPTSIYATTYIEISKSKSTGFCSMTYGGTSAFIERTGVWSNKLRREITIDSGADVTNQELIAFLQKNAELRDFYKVSKTDLCAVADAIRAKTGTTDPLDFPNGFISAISSIGN